jgi:Type II transport protein GspH
MIRYGGRMGADTDSRRSLAGFSILELVITLTVILILTVVAIPVVLKTVKVYHLNATAGQISGMLKYTRFEAIRRNTPVNCQIAQTVTGWILWADSNKNGQPDPTEKQIMVIGSETLIPAAGAPNPAALTGALGPGAAGLPLTVLSGVNSFMIYDPRGAVFFAGAPTIYVLYLGNPADAAEGFRAIVVLPSGVVQVWTGSAAGNWQQIS